jgi:hypothetical protein
MQRECRAGTANEQARATVEALLVKTLACRKVLAEVKARVEGFAVDSIVVERMAAVCAMALGCIMSGMGDLKTFKLLRCAMPLDCYQRLQMFTNHCLTCQGKYAARRRALHTAHVACAALPTAQQRACDAFSPYFSSGSSSRSQLSGLARELDP